MAVTPFAQIILDYKIFFGVKPPSDRISIIKHICRDSILVEIAALNYRLKPRNQPFIDNRYETQIEELRYFTKTKELFNKYKRVTEKYVNSKYDYPNIFNRQGCLFALEEIINSNQLETKKDDRLSKSQDWEAIIKYLLAINYEITQKKKKRIITWQVLNH